MPKCPDCKTEMKPLFTGFFCPRDCDKPEVQAARKAELEEALKKTAKPRVWVYNTTSFPYSGNFFPVPVAFSFLKKDKSKGNHGFPPLR